MLKLNVNFIFFFCWLSDDCMSEKESRAGALNPNTKLTTRSIGFSPLDFVFDEAEGKLKVDIQLIPHLRPHKATQPNDISFFNEPWTNKKINKEPVAANKRQWKHSRAYDTTSTSGGQNFSTFRHFTTFHSITTSAHALRQVVLVLCSYECRFNVMLSHRADECIGKHHSSTSFVSSSAFFPSSQA